MEIDLAAIKELREQTGAGVVESKQALLESGGDIQAAIDYLRKRGQATAQKKQARITKEGVIGSYIHPNKKIATLVELSCETDFVARTDAFQELAHELAMQVAATNPSYLLPDDVQAADLQHEKEIILGSAEIQGKPAAVAEKIVTGKIEKFYREKCLLKQPYIKDDTRTIEDLLTGAVSKFGENIKVGRFIRFQL